MSTKVFSLKSSRLFPHFTRLLSQLPVCSLHFTLAIPVLSPTDFSSLAMPPLSSLSLISNYVFHLFLLFAISILSQDSPAPFPPLSTPAPLSGPACENITTNYTMMYPTWWTWTITNFSAFTADPVAVVDSEGTSSIEFHLSDPLNDLESQCGEQ